MKYLTWNLRKHLIPMIIKILNNKFDCFIVIEGSRGLGKSTMAFHITNGIWRQMKKEGIKKYKFHIKHSLLYTRKEVIKFFHKWNSSGIADEMINVSFNRDFYNEDQKDLIKMINMNRDHCNMFIACVPQFANLDTQIKGLCKIRITVIRRGLAIIQTPNRTIYGKDKWDSAINEKIEREWLQKGITNPRYSRLTTFRGMIKFPPLTKKQEILYQRVKDEKRNIVARDQMGIIDDEKKLTDPVEIAIKLLLEGKVRNAIQLEGIGLGSGIDGSNFKSKITRRLQKIGKPNQLSQYYWDKKVKEKVIDEASLTY